ncbi:MAG: endonuclease/exonuclease/phosphatase family protein [Desulfobacterales bacterium]|jgi:endonuclease/exonuclease/phosphatase family metal-dependent hydrolase
MRLLTLNIRFGAGSESPGKPGYDVPSSKRKLRAVADAVASVDPDVVALQEVYGALQAERIAGHIGMKSIYTRHPISYALDFFEWGLAFCHRSKTLQVSNPTLEGTLSARSRRKMLMATLEMDEGPVTFVNVHFDPRGIVGQAESLVGLFPDEAAPRVLMGDFNCRADDVGLGAVRRQWVDSCRAVKTEASREADQVGTLPGRRERIDHIFIDPRFHRVVEAGLVSADYRRVSDHVAYFADLRPELSGQGR